MRKIAQAKKLVKTVSCIWDADCRHDSVQVLKWLHS